MTSLRWISRSTEMPRNSTRISLSRTGAASMPATECEVSGDQQRRERADGEHQPVQGKVERRAAAARNRGRSRSATLKPSVEPSALGLHQHAVEDHRHGEAEHREEDVAVAREQETDQERDDAGRGRGGRQQQEDVAQPGVAPDQRHRIGADRVEQRLSERHEAGPPQDHEPEHHQGVGERDGGERHQPGGRERRRHGKRDESQRSENGLARPHVRFSAAGPG